MKNLLIVACSLTVFGCRGWDTEERPIDIIKNMDTQQKGKAGRRDSTGLFADGRISRLPVEGTVAQGDLGDDSVLEEGLDEKGKPTQKFPANVKANWEAQVERGHNRYNIYCTPCHGSELNGKGAVAGLALDGGPRLLVAPASLHSERVAKELPVGGIYSAIRNGVNNGNMYSYASQIPVADRWAIVAYVKSEQMKKDDTVEQEPGGIADVGPVLVADAKVGEALYKAKNCSACHSLDGTRVVGPTFKGIWGRKDSTDKGEVVVNLEYVKESIANPMAKIVTGYPPAMPPYVLTDLEVESITLFMQTLN